jgi:hypothetical protein
MIFIPCTAGVRHFGICCPPRLNRDDSPRAIYPNKLLPQLRELKLHHRVSIAHLFYDYILLFRTQRPRVLKIRARAV